jgi:hypothetical protein
MELMPLSKGLAAPAPECLQFLGTVVDNTIALLTALANAIDGGSRNIRFDKASNWLSLMQAVHRSFFSSILIATEAALAGICRELNIEVVPSSKIKATEIVQRLKGRISERDAKDIMGLAGKQPQFSDYLNVVLKRGKLRGADATMWRKYFRALSIIRNKASHYDTTLSDVEVTALKGGGFSVAVTDGRLGVNPRMYRQVIEHTKRFFGLILSKLGGVSNR